ncbi:MAG: hypothetical protein RQ982_00485 [Gammaproteobacteria bacterium]|nr:hypothetical protein [Gammaproteobacteria bacterium]
MWEVQYKSKNNFQPWCVLESFDDKAAATVYAAQVIGEYSLVIVTGPDGSVVWSN